MIREAKLVRSARRLRWAALAGIATVVAVMAAGAWVLATGARFQGAVSLSYDFDGLPPHWATLVLGTVGLLMVLALLQISAMMRAVERGAPFRSGARLRRFALYLFLAVLAAVLLPPLAQWLETLLSSQPRRVTLSLSGEEALMLFVTGLLFFVARLIEAAQHLSDEHEQIV